MDDRSFQINCDEHLTLYTGTHALYAVGKLYDAGIFDISVLTYLKLFSVLCVFF